MSSRSMFHECILAAILLAVPGLATGCHSYHIETTVENRTGAAIQLLEVDYPSASFGADSLAAGAVFNYAAGRIVVWVPNSSALDPATALRNMHVAGFAPDESLVRFDVAGKLLKRSFMDSHTNAVIHEPSRLLRDSESASGFSRANTILAIDDHPERDQPFINQDRRLFHHGSGLHGELGVIVFSVALPDPLFFDPEYLLGIAARALHYAIGPAKLVDNEVFAVLELGEVDDCFLQGLWRFHVMIMRLLV